MNKLALKDRDSLIAVAAVFLLAVFPVLALHSFNIRYVYFSAVPRSIFWVLLGTSLFLILTWIVFRSWIKAALVSSLFLILFFGYGHAYGLLSVWLGIEIPNLFLSSVWLVLFAFLAWRAAKAPATTLSKWGSGLFTAASLLVILNVVSILSFEITKAQANRASQLSLATQLPASADLEVGSLPDIYLIVLDAHARSDVLLEQFGYEDSAFITELEDTGFFVADCSQANYWRTEFSVGSALRMEYWADEFREASALPDWQHSAVFQFLKNWGYQIVAFETRALHNQNLGEDILLSRRTKSFLYENIYPFANLNDFEANLIKTTWLQSWLQLLGNYSEYLPSRLVLDADNAAYLEHYRQVLYMLDELPRVPYLDSPKFVYVHFLVPHEPFVFEPNGRYLYRDTQNEFEEGYRSNVEFIDAKLAPVLRQVIANSSTPSIIVLMGDHGPNGSPPQTLLPILNAYYFPGGGESLLYENISPINTFRIIFNYYFGQTYPLLDDLSYYARGTALDEAEPFPNLCE